MRASESLLPAEGVFKSEKLLRLFVQVVFPCSLIHPHLEGERDPTHTRE